MITSSLFPHLAQPNRNPFRLAMFIMLTALVGLSLLRILGPVVTLSALGVPLLFVLYLWQTGIYLICPGGCWRSRQCSALCWGGLDPSTGGMIARPTACRWPLIRPGTCAGRRTGHLGFRGVLDGCPAVVVRLMRPALTESLTAS